MRQLGNMEAKNVRLPATQWEALAVISEDIQKAGYNSWDGGKAAIIRVAIHDLVDRYGSGEVSIQDIVKRHNEVADQVEAVARYDDPRELLLPTEEAAS